jgi:hypothetical protein
MFFTVEQKHLLRTIMMMSQVVTVLRIFQEMKRQGLVSYCEDNESALYPGTFSQFLMDLANWQFSSVESPLADTSARPRTAKSVQNGIIGTFTWHQKNEIHITSD